MACGWVGGWVRWVRWVEEIKAVRMSYCEPRGGWMGGWVGGEGGRDVGGWAGELDRGDRGGLNELL